MTGNHWFVIEDTFIYKGISLKRKQFSDKLTIFADFMSNSTNTTNTLKSKDFKFVLPLMWTIDETMTVFSDTPSLPEHIQNTIGYTAHHMQYRSTSNIMPYLNVFLNRKLNALSTIHRPHLITVLKRHLRTSLKLLILCPILINPI